MRAHSLSTAFDDILSAHDADSEEWHALARRACVLEAHCRTAPSVHSEILQRLATVYVLLLQRNASLSDTDTVDDDDNACDDDQAVAGVEPNSDSDVGTQMLRAFRRAQVGPVGAAAMATLPCACNARWRIH